MVEIISLDQLKLYSITGTHIPVSVKIAEAGIAIKNNIDGNITSLKKEEMKFIELFWGLLQYNLRITTSQKTYDLFNIPIDMTEQIKKSVHDWYALKITEKETEVVQPTAGKLNYYNENIECRKNEKLIFDLTKDDIENILQVKNEIVISLKEKDEGVSEIKMVCDESVFDKIKENAEIQQASELFKLENIHFVHPRGRNDLIFYEKYIKLIGKTFEHRVTYKNIKDLYLVVKERTEEEESYYLIFKLKSSLRQGNTNYEFIVFLISTQQEAEIKIELTEDVRTAYPSLKAVYNGELPNILPNILTALAGRSIKRDEVFETLTGNTNIPCTLKAYEGTLHPLDNILLFLPKVIAMPHNSITMVEFSRVNVSSNVSKSFDMRVITHDMTYAFTNLPKDEFGAFEKYFSDRKIEMRTEVFVDEISSEYESETEDEEDEEITGIISDSEE